MSSINETVELEAVGIKPLSFGQPFSAVDHWLDSEREQLPLFIPVALGLGMALWQVQGAAAALPLFLVCAGCLLFAASAGHETRFGYCLAVAALLVGLGFAIISGKAHMVGATPLQKPWVGTVIGKVENVEEVSAREMVRFRLRLSEHGDLPEVVRVNVQEDAIGSGFAPGTIIKVKVRLMPPPGPQLPGSYDFARTAWFAQIGAIGRAIGPITLVALPERVSNFWNVARNATAARIERSLGPESGPVGAALLVGARGSISEADAEALRNSGMAHLLSVSGLHVTAVVGAVFILLSGLLALWPWLALRLPEPLLAAGGSALVAVLYTLLTGAEVPTVRACIAALLILIAMALGREALSMRLLAAGATFVLLFWPESLAGPSFQLSFAAVGTIIMLHTSGFAQRFLAGRDEAMLLKLGRGLLALLLTGLAIEAVLAPIALFHFHKSGLYGALANIIAIPATTFVVMPAELLGLLLDAIVPGAGSPFWWVASQGIQLILWIAHSVSAAPGAVALLPEMPLWSFGVAAICLLVIALLKTRWRWVMLVPCSVAIVAMVSAPRPDLLLTGDGQHLAVKTDNGQLALLRAGAGDYARSILGETAAIAGDAVPLDDMPGARCNGDGCSFVLERGGRSWRIIAIRSRYMLPAMELAAACRRADIVISSRRLPWSCKPLWLKADRAMLEQTGGLAFYLSQGRVTTVASENAHHPWSAYAPVRIAEREAARKKERAARNIPPPKSSLEIIDQ